MSPRTLPKPNGLPLDRVSKQLGLSSTMVRSLVDSGFVTPELDELGDVSFSFQDMVLIRAAGELRTEVSPKKIQSALKSIREQLPEETELSTVSIRTQGRKVVAQRGERSWDTSSGQNLLNFEDPKPANVQDMPGLDHAPERVTALDWYELACELEGHDREQARDAYRRTLELEPRHTEARINLGRVLHEVGELQAAETHYRFALALHPKDAVAAFNLGVVLEDRGEAEEALEAYQTSVDSDENNADAHYNLARLHEHAGRLPDALRHYQAYRRLTR